MQVYLSWSNWVILDVVVEIEMLTMKHVYLKAWWSFFVGFLFIGYTKWWRGWLTKNVFSVGTQLDFISYAASSMSRTAADLWRQAVTLQYTSIQVGEKPAKNVCTTLPAQWTVLIATSPTQLADFNLNYITIILSSALTNWGGYYCTYSIYCSSFTQSWEISCGQHSLHTHSQSFPCIAVDHKLRAIYFQTCSSKGGMKQRTTT